MSPSSTPRGLVPSFAAHQRPRHGHAVVWVLVLLAAGPRTAVAQTGPPPEPSEPTQVAEAEPEQDAPAHSPTDSEGEARAARAQKVLAQEPTWSLVHQATLEHFRVTQRGLDRLRYEVRAKSGTPNLTWGGSVRPMTSRRTTAVAPADTGGQVVDTQDDYETERLRTFIALSWNLPRAVFTPSQIQVYQLMHIQRALLRNVNRMYWVRRQLLSTLLMDPPEDIRARVCLRIRISGFTTLIDSHTGGWFSRQLPEGSL